jgi:hypothetical protein
LIPPQPRSEKRGSEDHSKENSRNQSEVLRIKEKRKRKKGKRRVKKEKEKIEARAPGAHRQIRRANSRRLVRTDGAV